ncbi:hypothetical protein TCCBUS3UF1_590 [Thermus sp. CCB_US3_UF1]|uniref:hypothetical protein n=1 Tax=Thermus sp. CCB_US3_UF1 TaxID=1111069 RepID=UPI000238A2B2|nr:hypothetical protein [Thermus sp. CCB_US3_UF1]AEV15109.1 hypothetical protein TCCBUS3UF1_590 [Thermus sp. CCB_US3_UF1]
MTPLAQYAVTLYASSLFAQKDDFKRLVEEIFTTNYKNPDEAFEHLKDFWFGNKSLVNLFTLFVSRSDYNRIEYEGAPGTEDPEEKAFLDEEDKCKYELVYPYFGDLQKTLDQFSMARPSIVRQVAQKVRTSLNQQRGGASFYISLMQESFDLLLPAAVRRKYLARLRPVLNVLSSNPRRITAIPAGLLSATQEIDELSRELSQELGLKESYEDEHAEGSAPLLPLYEGKDDTGLFSELATALRRQNLTILSTTAKMISSQVISLARQALDFMASSYKGDPEAFTRAVHNVVDHAFYSALGLNGLFPVYVYDYRVTAIDEHERVVPIFFGFLERELLVGESTLAGAYLALVHSGIARAKDGKSLPLPQMIQGLAKQFAKSFTAKRVAEKVFKESGMGDSTRDLFEVDEPEAVPVNLTPRQVFAQGLANMLSEKLAPPEVQRSGYRTFYSIQNFILFRPKFANAVVKVASENPGFMLDQATQDVQRGFRTGFNTYRGRSV